MSRDIKAGIMRSDYVGHPEEESMFPSFLPFSPLIGTQLRGRGRFSIISSDLMACMFIYISINRISCPSIPRSRLD